MVIILTGTFIVSLVAKSVAGTIVVANAFDFKAAEIEICRVSQVAKSARASDLVIENVAHGIRTADLVAQAGIRATAFGADQCLRTIRIFGAAVWQQTTGFGIGVSDGTRRTKTAVRSRDVVTYCAEVTRRFFAFVDIEATVLGVSKPASTSRNN